MKQPAPTFKPKRLPGYSKADLIKEIQRVIRDDFEGRVPYAVQFQSSFRAGMTTLYRAFGTYGKALLAAGFTPPHGKKFTKGGLNISPDQLLLDLKRVLEINNRKLYTLQFYSENGGVTNSKGKIKRILGMTFTNALLSLGATPKARYIHMTENMERRAAYRKLSDDELLERLHALWQTLGRLPKRAELDKSAGDLSISLYARRFGSWSKAIEALCLKKQIPMPQVYGTSITKIVKGSSEAAYKRTQLTKADLLHELHKTQQEYPNLSLTHKLYKSSGGKYHIETFRNHFGSWQKAVEEAGSTPGLSRYSDEALFDELQRLWEKLGRQPKFDEMTKFGKISAATYHKRFGSWVKAIYAFCEDRNSDSTELAANVAASPVLDSASLPIIETPLLKHDVTTPTDTPRIMVRKTGRQIGARLRFRVFQRDNFTCKACGRSPSMHGIALEADHILAYTEGGETVFDNLQTLCADCNKGKSNHPM